MSMIERVERAIREADIAATWKRHPERSEEEMRMAADEIASDHREMAIAAIEAMGEPTEDMMIAAWRVQFAKIGATPAECEELAARRLSNKHERDHFRAGWSAAVQAALNEKPEN